MKIKFICMILVLSLITSVSFAEGVSPTDLESLPAVMGDVIQSDAASVPSNGISSDGELQSKDDENEKKDETEKQSADTNKESSGYMTKDEYIELVENKLNMELHDTTVSFFIDSLNSYVYIGEDRFLDAESRKVKPDAKEALIDLLVSVYDSINANSQVVNDSDEIRKIVDSVNGDWRESNDNVMRFAFRTDDNWFVIMLTDVGIRTPWGYFRTDKAEQIIADAEAAIYSHKDIFLIDTQVTTREVDPETVRVTERLTFDIKMTNEHEKTIFMQFGDIGNVLNCSVENVRINTSDYFIFTISGSKKTESYYTQVHTLDFTTGNAGNTLTFYTNSTYDGNVLSYIREQKQAEFTIGGATANGKITKAVISVESRGYGRSIENVQGTNTNYEFLDEINTMNSVRNMYVLFGMTKESVLKYYTSGGEVQDPEYYKTPLRAVYDDGETVFDFYLPFICHIKPNKELKGVPSWYKALGDNVEITFIGVTQTLNGKDRRGYTMIRFAGDKGTKWFDNNITQPSINSAKKEYQVYNTYNSMLSFNDFVKIKNTVEYDETYATLFFNDDENRSFKSIKFKIGNEVLEVPESDIKYIGGGKIAYEKLW